MDKILVITPSMPTDISLASVVKFMGCQVKIMSTEELRKPDLVSNITQLLRVYSVSGVNKVILTGPYWDTFSNVPINNCEIIKFINTKHTHEDLVRLISISVPNFGESTLSNNHKLFELLDFRYNCDSDKILETEPLFAGLSNHKESTNDKIITKMDSLFDTIQDILFGRIKFEQIMNEGMKIFKAHIALSVDRAEKNSHTVILKDGTKAAITCASDLINLTHEQLHKKYPEINVTVTTALQFQKDNTTALSLSVRTYNTDISVKTILNEVNKTVGYAAMGSDSDNATGGRVKFNEFNDVLVKANFLKE